MHAFIKIFLLVFAIHSPLNAMGELPSRYLDNRSEIQPGETDHTPFGYPSAQPDFYAIHPQAEGSVQITNRVPQSQSSTEREYNLFRGSAPEPVTEQWVTCCIRDGSLIETGLTPGKLLYPFHFFL